MKINRRKILEIATIAVLSLIIILLLILGIQSSNFTMSREYNVGTKPQKVITAYRALRNGMQVTIVDDSIANLGDFVFNISGDRKLVANIAIKYKSTKNDTYFFNNQDDVKNEILKKSVILRDATINTMLGYSIADPNDEEMREKLRDTLNKNLANSEIEEVYFNKFIIR